MDPTDMEYIGADERASIVNVPKLERAYELYHELGNRSQAILNSELLYETQIFGLKPNQHDRFFWTQVPSAHPELGIIAGELVHDVRSSLDHLVSDLQKEKGLKRSATSQFPLYVREGDWNTRVLMRGDNERPCETCGHLERGSNPLEGLNDDQISLIGEYQPFATRAVCGLMNQLRLMSNVDKHRTLHACGIRIRQPDSVAYEPAGYFEAASVECDVGEDLARVGAEFARVERKTLRQPSFDTQMKVHWRGSAQLAFYVEGEAPVASVQDLAWMINAAYVIHVTMSPESTARLV
ncbi:MAG TPA: hypothetical protein VMV53_09105 [Acidimicrobiales bacterium]|nr:hypothetical protein [Acidimicrobiales bacterium]